MLTKLFRWVRRVVSSRIRGAFRTAQRTIYNQRVPLKVLAARRNLLMGTAVSYTALKSSPLYVRTLCQEYNLIAVENAFKWLTLRPERDQFAFEQGDFIVNFADANKLAVRGHPLVWAGALPVWLQKGAFSKDELAEILHTHITTIVRHYAKSIQIWDVVNMALKANGDLSESLWYHALGANYIDQAFQWAYEAAPQARLFYNDYNIEALTPKSDAVYKLVKGMLERGIPIHGVGLQAHFAFNHHPAIRDITANIDRLGQLGLEVHITECDVSAPGMIRASASGKRQILRAQAAVYHDVMAACLQSKYCTAFVTWGFSDAYSWQNNAHKPFHALPFDEHYRPKPAYYGLHSALQESYHSVL